jgi:hypothetical protein
VANLHAGTHDSDCADCGHDASGSAHRAAYETRRGDQRENAREHQEPFRRFFMTMERGPRHDDFDAIFLRYAGFLGDPGAEGERDGERQRYGPYPTRCSAFPDSPECDRNGDW